jgi:hypothetical protein
MQFQYTFRTLSIIHALRSVTAREIQTPKAPNVQRKMILARRSSQRANRKFPRSGFRQKAAI